MPRDMRNPYGSRGGYASSRRMRRMRDRGMDYTHDMPMHREDYNYEREMMDGRRRRNARGQYMADRGYEHEMPHEMDYGSFHEERGFRPVEAMGYFTGYYGGGEDYGRYDMRGRGMRYDGNYPYLMGDYGDYGETLTKEELEHWNKKMLKEVDEKYKHFFTKENIAQKARAMGVQMEGFSEDELLTATIAMYTDFCDALKPYIGENMDAYVRMGRAFMMDKDASVKGGEKLAVYYDSVVEGEDD